MGHNLGLAHDQGYNAIMLHCQDGALPRGEDVPSAERRIDLWWAGGATSAFSPSSPISPGGRQGWSQAKLGVLAEGKTDHPGRTERKIAEMLDQVRMEAAVVVIEGITEEEIRQFSSDAALTFFPGALRQDSLDARFGLDLNMVAEALPLVAICLAGEEIDLDPDPDDLDQSAAQSDDAHTSAGVLAAR